MAALLNHVDAAVRVLFAALLTAALAACGVTAPRGSDGFANLDSLGLSDTDRVLTLSIGPALLNFAAGHVDDDPETRALLQSLDGVRVRVYEIDGDPGRVASRMDRMSIKLQADGWEPVLRVRESRETLHMLVRTVDGRIRGMTVLGCDGDSEAVVVNLMGEIRPEQFSAVMVALDVDTPAVKTGQAGDSRGG